MRHVSLTRSGYTEKSSLPGSGFQNGTRGYGVRCWIDTPLLSGCWNLRDSSASADRFADEFGRVSPPNCGPKGATLQTKSQFGFDSVITLTDRVENILNSLYYSTTVVWPELRVPVPPILIIGAFPLGSASCNFVLQSHSPRLACGLPKESVPVSPALDSETTPLTGGVRSSLTFTTLLTGRDSTFGCCQVRRTRWYVTCPLKLRQLSMHSILGGREYHSTLDSCANRDLTGVDHTLAG